MTCAVDGVQIYDDKTIIIVTNEVRREIAEYRGRGDTKTAKILEERLRFYTMGRSGEIPVSWQKYIKCADPEWDEYQRLLKKFSTQ